MHGIAEKVRLFLLVFLLAVPFGTAYCQMSDEAVVKYALEGRQSGKSDQQIGKELLARGVTPEQVERLKQKYEDSRTSSETVAADQVISGQRRERPRSSSDTLAVEIPPVPDPAERGADSRAVFGRNVFRSRALTFEPNENQATPENYRLGPGDEVIIDIWGENERSLREEISPEGNIMVEQVGPVYLNGLTIKEANAKLRGVFGQIYAGVSGDSPASEVRVTLGRLRTIQVNVMGEVEMPGTYRLSSFATVFHALYQAGGVTDIGTLRNIRVLRSGREVASVDIYKYLFHGDSKDDIRLEEGDIVLVPSYDLLVEVTGCVKRPMRYEMEAGEPLSQLLAYAGGFTGDAYGREVRVVRTMGREHELFNGASVGPDGRGFRCRRAGARSLCEPDRGSGCRLSSRDVRTGRGHAYGPGVDRTCRRTPGGCFPGPGLVVPGAGRPYSGDRGRGPGRGSFGAVDGYFPAAQRRIGRVERP